MPKSNLAERSDDVGLDARRQLKILILDDDEFDRRHIQRLSAKLAFPTVIDEADGLIALQDRLDSQSYDAILIDYRLAKGNGLDALDIIANHPINKSAAQIMVAGDPHYELAVQAMKHGCDEFLGKDKLDANSMQKSVVDAILTSTKKVSANLHLALDDLANTLAKDVAEVCLANMKPMLSRLLRQTDLLKAHGSSLSDQGSSAVIVIEQSCRVLGSFLEDLESRANKAVQKTAAKVVPLIK